MNTNLENLLKRKYPDLFINLSYIECKDGWYELLNNLCIELSDVIEKQKDKNYYFEQLKEKFGGLRVYMNQENEEIRSIIEKFEKESYSVCQECGSLGKPETIRGWVFTLCEDHKNKYLNKTI